MTNPSDYESGASFRYYADFTAQITATFGWLGGASATLAMPDFTGVRGWRNDFAPASSGAANWSFTATASNRTTWPCCAEGGTVRQADINGKT